MTSITILPPYLQQRLLEELRPGERLVWVGQPVSSRHIKSGFKLWFFFVPWTAFALFWMAAASRFRIPQFNDGWDAFPLFGLPFLLIGIGGLLSPLWIARRVKSTVYAITNLRALVISGTKSITVKSYPASDIIEVERTEYPDGTGDVILRAEAYRDSDGDRRTRQHGFFAVANVRQVARLIEDLKSNPFA